MGMKSALITGITGQDGSYLAEFLLAKGYKVYGLVRRSSTPNTTRISHILSDITLLSGDLLDQSSLLEAVETSCPDEIYNLAAMSHVAESFRQPVSTMEVTGLGAVRLFEAVRLTGGFPRVYQASSSEIVGQQNQLTFAPKSPYATAKLYAHWSAVNYRQGYNLYICSGILYNHESPRRGGEFVTRKITKAVSRIRYGLQDALALGNLSGYRDWGFAGDYVKAMWLMLQQDTPKDYVIATGESHSVAEFARKCFEYAGISDWTSHVKIDASLYRPNEVDVLVGDPKEAMQALGWAPSVNFDELIGMMMESDLSTVREGKRAYGLF